MGQVGGETLEPPQALPWYPGKLAWRFAFSRAQLRKLPMLEAIHELVSLLIIFVTCLPAATSEPTCKLHVPVWDLVRS